MLLEECFLPTDQMGVTEDSEADRFRGDHREPIREEQEPSRHGYTSPGGDSVSPLGPSPDSSSCSAASGTLSMAPHMLTTHGNRGGQDRKVK